MEHKKAEVIDSEVDWSEKEFVLLSKEETIKLKTKHTKTCKIN